MPECPALHLCCKASIGALNIAVDFSAAKQWTVLFGPSGSGKSSLLRVIAGLWQPQGVVVRLGDDDLSRRPAHLRRIGFVAQEPALFPHMNVLENVRFGLRADAEGRQVTDAALDLFQLQALRKARIGHLSGGERQRVALARALAPTPRLLLLDEVFTGMHLQQRDDLLRRVQQHCRQNGIPVLSVTHDTIEASLIADEVLKLEAGRVITRGAAAAVLANEREALRQTLTGD